MYCTYLWQSFCFAFAHWQWVLWSALRQPRIWTRRIWVHISGVTITSNNWSGLYPYLCGKHMCKADPSVGHQNRRVNTQLEALTPVLLKLLLWPCVRSPSGKNTLEKNMREVKKRRSLVCQTFCVFWHAAKLEFTVYFETHLHKSTVNLFMLWCNSDSAERQCVWATHFDSVFPQRIPRAFKTSHIRGFIVFHSKKTYFRLSF